MDERPDLLRVRYDHDAPEHSGRSVHRRQHDDQHLPEHQRQHTTRKSSCQKQVRFRQAHASLQRGSRKKYMPPHQNEDHADLDAHQSEVDVEQKGAQ